MTERSRVSISLAAAAVAGALGVAAIFYGVTGVQSTAHATLAADVSHHSAEIARNAADIKELRGEIRGELRDVNGKLDRLLQAMSGARR